MFAGPQDCSADEFGGLVECQTNNENATNYGDTCTVAYIGMYFLSILFWSQFSGITSEYFSKCHFFLLM